MPAISLNLTLFVGLNLASMKTIRVSHKARALFEHTADCTRTTYSAENAPEEESGAGNTADQAPPRFEKQKSKTIPKLALAGYRAPAPDENDTLRDAEREDGGSGGSGGGPSARALEEEHNVRVPQRKGPSARADADAEAEGSGEGEGEGGAGEQEEEGHQPEEDGQEQRLLRTRPPRRSRPRLETGSRPGSSTGPQRLPPPPPARSPGPRPPADGEDDRRGRSRASGLRSRRRRTAGGAGRIFRRQPARPAARLQ